MARHEDEFEYDPFDEAAKYSPARDDKGRYLPRNSGNPRGRKMQFKRDPKLPASRRRIISDVADKLIDVKLPGGEKRKMSLFEANVVTIAVAGAKGDRVGAQKFIDLMLELADRDLERRLATRQLLERMNQIAEENEELKRRFAPKSGVLVVSAEELERFNAERRLDDEESVSQAISRNPQCADEHRAVRKKAPNARPWPSDESQS